jgi:hypothetical protein
MPPTHPDHAREQAYIERANKLAEGERDSAAGAATAGADKFAMREIRRRALDELPTDFVNV